MAGDFAQQYEATVDDVLDLVATAWSVPRSRPRMDAALAGQASSVLPALASNAIDHPDPAHRAFTRRKLSWWVGAMQTASAALPALA